MFNSPSHLGQCPTGAIPHPDVAPEAGTPPPSHPSAPSVTGRTFDYKKKIRTSRSLCERRGRIGLGDQPWSSDTVLEGATIYTWLSLALWARESVSGPCRYWMRQVVVRGRGTRDNRALAGSQTRILSRETLVPEGRAGRGVRGSRSTRSSFCERECP